MKINLFNNKHVVFICKWDLSKRIRIYKNLESSSIELMHIIRINILGKVFFFKNEKKISPQLTMTADGIDDWSNRLVFYFRIDNVLSDIQEDTFRIT